MKNILLLILSFGALTVYGQIDQTQMNRDLEVAENILNSMIRGQGSDHVRYFGNDRNIEGSYHENYGVIFRISNHFALGDAIVISDKSWRLNSSDHKKGIIVNRGDKDNDNHFDLAGAVTNFLVDYGNLIHQLKRSDKIMVKTGSKRSDNSYVWLSRESKKKENQQTVSAEVLKSDLDAFEAGSLTREEIIEKVKVTESTVDFSKDPQLEVFSSILKRLYQVDLTDTYYMANHPSYERVTDFGVTFYLKFYSSRVHDDDTYSLPTVDKNKISKKERDGIVEEMYPPFLDGFKTNLLEYGHVLKSLAPSEMVTFQIKLTSCEGCDMPAEIELTTKKSTIDDYRTGSMSLGKALAGISVSKVK